MKGLCEEDSREERTTVGLRALARDSMPVEVSMTTLAAVRPSGAAPAKPSEAGASASMPNL